MRVSSHPNGGAGYARIYCLLELNSENGWLNGCTVFFAGFLFAANAGLEQHPRPMKALDSGPGNQKEERENQKMWQQDAASGLARAIAAWESAHERGLEAIAVFGTDCSFMPQCSARSS
jgi:hypothetical protein